MRLHFSPRRPSVWSTSTCCCLPLPRNRPLAAHSLPKTSARGHPTPRSTARHAPSPAPPTSWRHSPSRRRGPWWELRGRASPSPPWTTETRRRLAVRAVVAPSPTCSDRLQTLSPTTFSTPRPRPLTTPDPHCSTTSRASLSPTFSRTQITGPPSLPTRTRRRLRLAPTPKTPTMTRAIGPPFPRLPSTAFLPPFLIPPCCPTSTTTMVSPPTSPTRPTTSRPPRPCTPTHT